MLFRLGYRGHTTADYVMRAKALNADYVIDCRYRPFGNRNFAKSAIKPALEAVGIKWEWWGGLGNELYKEGGIRIKNPADIDRVHELAKDHVVILMCACETADKDCHTINILRGHSQ